MTHFKRYDFVSGTHIDNLYIVCKAGKWGIFNTDLNKEIISLQYDDVRVFFNDCFAVRSGDFWELVSSNSKLITTRRFNDISFFETDEYLLVTNPDSSQIISLNTLAVSNFYDEIDSYDNYLHVKKGGLWGVINKDFVEVIPLKYELLMRVSDTIYFVKENIDSDSNIIIIDLKNNTQTLSEYNSISELNYYPNMFKVTKGDFAGVIDSNLNVVIPIEYKHILPLQRGFFRVRCHSSNKEGLFNLHSGFVLECKYNDISELAPNLFSIKDDSYKCALFSPEAELLTEFKYALLRYCSDEYIYALVPASSNRTPSKYLEGKCFCGLLDFSGEELIKPIYDNIRLSEFAFVAEKSGKCCIYDSNFKKVSPIIFDDVRYIDKYSPDGLNFARVYYNNHEGYIYW